VRASAWWTSSSALSSGHVYELFGVVTNLFGGFIAARMGLRVTLLGGLALQIMAELKVEGGSD
jgi:MFS-type transporter involved in bile tolerance (Atg22 family)